MGLLRPLAPATILGVLVLLACADSTGPEPITADPEFNEWGGVATVVFEDQADWELLREYGAKGVKCHLGDNMGMRQRSAVVWLPESPVPSIVAIWPGVTELRPYYDPPYAPDPGPEPVGADTAMSGPLRVVATWQTCRDGVCKPAVPQYEVGDHCAAPVQDGWGWGGGTNRTRELQMSYENMADTAVVVHYREDARSLFELTAAERIGSDREAVPYPLVQPWPIWYDGAPPADTLAPGERVDASYLVDLGTTYFSVSAPAGTYRIEMTHATIEPGPSLSVYVRLNRPDSAH